MTAATFVFVAASLLVCGKVQSCSPTGQDIWSVPDTQKAHHYNDMLYGKVLETYEDTRFEYGGAGSSQVYTVKMKIYCIYKGDIVPAVVNISEAGMYRTLIFLVSKQKTFTCSQAVQRAT